MDVRVDGRGGGGAEADASAEVILAGLRRICLALPETSERVSHGSPAFFVRGKRILAYFADDPSDLALWCPAPPGVQESMVGEEPDRFFVPPYVGQHGWLGVRLSDELDWDELAAIIEEAYRTMAPRRLVARLDAERGGA
ncbi:MmcQ/YjbR family DNA-binding protein [Allostreptomyces psammosilenae]|uniref:Phosphoribosylglycinamide formyltransferase n=1 Tax=Allostreptomyces psammosilenae TaxID=1892865 RepID=A0A852ZZZ3_9ACTN|nr:MmcQ/YjbR family DNA-binding protein [Allostreptomyces psammosilenae]NYI07417.1 hypothetical protein [Allostreptomyces psammosilenae]